MTNKEAVSGGEIRGINCRTRRFYERFGKRVLDLTIVIPALILLCPLFLLIALVVRLTSSGPVIFRQKRIGREGRPLWVLKFRTMFEGAAVEPAAVSSDDPRITPFGRLLRPSKLDELPQLWNIVRGEMSLVGPRPLVPEQVMHSSDSSQSTAALRPGITSLASVLYRSEGAFLKGKGMIAADEFYKASILPVKEALNQRYAESLGLLLDLKILFLTAFLLFFPGKSRERTLRLGRLKVGLYGSPVRAAIDLAIFVAAVEAAYWLRYEGQPPDYIRAQLALVMIVLPFSRWAINRLVGIYDQMWRHFSFTDRITLTNSTLVCTAVLLALRIFLETPPDQFPYLRVPLGVIGGEFLLTIFMLVGARTLRKAVYEIDSRYRPPQRPDVKRVLIAGAGRAGLALAESLRQTPQFEVTGFVDDDPRKVGTRIGGKHVLGSSADISLLVESFGINCIAICYPADAEDATRRLREVCSSVGVPCTSIVDPGTLIANQTMAEVGPDSQSAKLSPGQLNPNSKVES